MSEVQPDAEVEKEGVSQSPLFLHIILFLVAAVTMTAAGLMAAELDPFEPSAWTNAGVLKALGYAGVLLAIVGCHEAGHFYAARRRGVAVSRPYFLPGIGPIPGIGVIPFFGTFGAFIKMGWSRMKAVDLMAIAGWGPVAGFVVTVPAVILGVAWSEPVALPDDESVLLLGDPLLIKAATALFHPNMPQGMELMLHPVGLAGWVGCLLTALNLLPLGQLDGGHLLYGSLGEKSRRPAKVAFGLLLLMGVVFFPGWLVLALLVWWMGLTHPPMLVGSPASGKERSMAWVCGAIFLVTFTPTPVQVDALPQWLGLW